MTEDKDLKKFPDLSNKLAAPTKKSQFERSKAEAEAKRIREEAETAAAYEEFVKSFDDEEAPQSSEAGARPRGLNGLEAPGPKLGATAPSKRHFVSGIPKQNNSGPGSLGPSPSILGKRSSDGSRLHEKDRERGLFAFEDAPTGPLDAATAFKTSEDEDEETAGESNTERAPSKPTIQMLSLPPGSSPATIKSLLPSSLTVDNVRILQPQDHGSDVSTARKSCSAIVTFTPETPASDVDGAVNGLQNRYLGWGYYLSLSRHLSSAALGSNLSGPSPLNLKSSLPFGANETNAQGPGSSLSRAPLPHFQRGAVPPPSSYAPNQQGPRNSQAMQVTVNPPSSVTQIKDIHKTIEAVLEHGPEFEALLMTRPEVQREEKWAWLWDARSPGGVWYRWRLWEIQSGVHAERKSQSRVMFGNPEPYALFENNTTWVEPVEDLSFEFSTRFDDLAVDPDFNSSDDDSSDDEAAIGGRARQRRFDGAAAGLASGLEIGGDAEEQSYLNPMQKAKLIHLLHRLPNTTARLKRGDVARITAFAIAHADAGAGEVVDLLLSNVIQPLSSARNISKEDEGSDSDTPMRDELDTKGLDHASQDGDADNKKEDNSSASLIGLHVISDVLSASSTSGVRHAWRYRTLFENSFAKGHIFAHLGRLEKDLSWGRLRAEKWKRSVHNVLTSWEQWCYFSNEVQNVIRRSFEKPPLTEKEKEQENEKENLEKKTRMTAKTKWKNVNTNGTSRTDKPATHQMIAEVKGGRQNFEEKEVPPEDLAVTDLSDAIPMPMNEILTQEQLQDDTIEKLEGGKSCKGPAEHKLASQDRSTGFSMSLKSSDSSSYNSSNKVLQRKKRPTAEDMFASDNE